jgi:hypothetical protein
VTTYFDKIDDKEAVRTTTNNGDNDTAMNSFNGKKRDGASVAAIIKIGSTYNVKALYRNKQTRH